MIRLSPSCLAYRYLYKDILKAQPVGGDTTAGSLKV